MNDTEQIDIEEQENTASETRNENKRPEGLPDKFWNHEANEIRVDQLVKSYGVLERKLGGVSSQGVPGTPEDYVLDDTVMSVDPDVNEKLHAAGFTQEQAQLVYDLAREKLKPVIDSFSQNFQEDALDRKMSEVYGGREKWDDVSRQMKSWGQAHLPPDVFNTLSGSYEGIMALNTLMKHSEPSIGRSSSSQQGVNEVALKEMMKDPRYWRDYDEAYIEKVRQGFQTFYPEED